MRLLLVTVLASGCGRIAFEQADHRSDATTDTAVDARGGCATQLAAGERHACFAVVDGSVHCAGDDVYGQLGRGSVGPVQAVPVAATVLGQPTAIAAGRSTTCGRRGDGSAACIGDNDNRQLDGATVISSSATPLVPATPALAGLALGGAYACALTATNEVMCWGDADEGQSGVGTNPDFHAPQLISSLGAVSALSAGTDHVCVVKNGEVSCWGDGRDDRLGAAAPDTCPGASAGTIACSTTPQLVPGVSGVVGISAGHAFTCAWTNAGTAICWGSNDRGQCARAVSPQEPPAAVASLAGVRQVVTGRDHACALVGDGSVWCWGEGTSLQLGSGTTRQFVPLQVPLAVEAETLVTHPMANYTCALLVDDHVWCWGTNDYGQLGRGSVGPLGPPAAVMLSCS